MIYIISLSLLGLNLKGKNMKLQKISTLEDIEIVKSFFYQIFPEENKYDLVHFEQSITRQHKFKRLEYYLGCENNALVGISGVYADNSDECWLGWFGIRPEYRRNGYASTILDLQLQMMKEYSYKVCRLYTDRVINKNAVNLYIKKGFKKDSAYENDIITMSKSLENASIPGKWIGKPLGFND